MGLRGLLVVLGWLGSRAGGSAGRLLGVGCGCGAF